MIFKNDMTPSSVSVIIPTNHSHLDLINVVNAIFRQTYIPCEIIIIDSYADGGECPIEIINQCLINGINLIYKHYFSAYPGQARNIGIRLSKADFIAFIDVQTIPKNCWLETSLRHLSNSDEALGVYGSTIFVGESFFELLVRDAFYGGQPRKTLPGSVFSRDVFVQAGLFIDWVRAGEDTDWLLRLGLLKIRIISQPVGLLEYYGLIGLTAEKIIKKWHRNYTASHDLPHLFPQKLFLWIVLYPLIIFIGFNWNYLIANWHSDSPLYFGHITKLAAILPFIIYVFMRGILLPLRHGDSISNLLPFRFIMIAAITLMADMVKAFAFSFPIRKGKN